eukprot:s3034_g7.t1
MLWLHDFLYLAFLLFAFQLSTAFTASASPEAEPEMPEQGAVEVSETQSKQLEVALSQTIQRLAAGAGRLRRKASQEEVEARLEREKQELPRALLSFTAAGS